MASAAFSNLADTPFARRNFAIFLSRAANLRLVVQKSLWVLRPRKKRIALLNYAPSSHSSSTSDFGISISSRNLPFVCVMNASISSQLVRSR